MTNQVEISEKIRSLLDPRLELVRVEGQRVVLLVKEVMKTPDRGKLLLDTEKYLRRELSRPVEIYLDPRGDINKLRQQLRGISLDGSRDEVFEERYNNPETSNTGVGDKDDE